MKNKNLIIVGVITLLVGAVAGFFGGKTYQAGQVSATRSHFAGTFAGASANTTSVRGQVLSNDPTGMVVKLSDGSTKIVILSASTPIGKMTTGSASDLTVGTSVTVLGTANSDGSVSATSVQIGSGLRGNASPSPKASP